MAKSIAGHRANGIEFAVSEAWDVAAAVYVNWVRYISIVDIPHPIDVLIELGQSVRRHEYFNKIAEGMPGSG